MQPLDSQYWNEYANNFSSHYNEEMAKFIKDLALSLRAQNVLEVGCSAGNDLKLFSQGIDVNGIDISETSISRAKENLPEFNFKIGEITAIPFENDSMDIVFTRNVFNYLESSNIKKSVDELFRVSRKYIFNIELFSENEEKIENQTITTHGRNMKKHWLDYNVKIISNVEMHEEIDPRKSRFTLLRKI